MKENNISVLLNTVCNKVIGNKIVDLQHRCVVDMFLYPMM